MISICILLVVGVVFYVCNQVNMADNVFQAYYNLADFLPTYIIGYSGRGIEISDYNCGLYFTLQFYQFLLHLF